MRHPTRPRRHRLVRAAALASIAAALALAGPAHADGMLGIFFDRNAMECSGSISSGSSKTLYVILLTSGATSRGVTGAEFRIEYGAAGAYLFQNERAAPNVAIRLGNALGNGTNIAFSDCETSGNVALLSFQVLNPGSAGEASLFIAAAVHPSNQQFACPSAVLCDHPTYTQVCVESGRAILNPRGDRPCGSTRENSEWTRVKALFR